MRKMRRVSPPISIRKRRGVHKSGCLMYIVVGVGLLGSLTLLI
ncbi:hypothetical protein GCM10008931_43290 [Oceanobacillus oncorhynchi subsp. oncorhynchi]